MNDLARRVFLSHNSADKPFVLRVADRLREDRITFFLDEADLVPGTLWQAALEDALRQSDACAVFIGPNGFGHWHELEMRVALNQLIEAEREYRVIPVLLPGTARPADADLPAFLHELTWVEFHGNPEEDVDAYRRLKSGILGQAAGFLPRRSTAATAEDLARLKIVPRGLRSFERQHYGFFLKLVPGRPDQRGLPTILAEWKTLIEEIDPDRTFRVAYWFGASGCGKSSLLKAGLIPALAEFVVVVQVEAAAEETETRVLRELRKQVRTLPEELDLAAAFAWLVDHPKSLNGRKLLLVLDQFEQWLHASQGRFDGELAAALRHCNGRHLQCLLVVRDDFNADIHRFMKVVDPARLLQEDREFQLIDLFGPDFARQVLFEYGRAYDGRLPDTEDLLTPPQRQFLDRVVSDLQREETKVVPIQLSLLAQMLEHRPWTPETLNEIGGAAGVCLKFLRTKFDERSASAKCKAHRDAAARVLQSLLPVPGTGIMGQRQPREVLLQQSGYRHNPADFGELIDLLDRELRMITPVEDEATPTYQLTHDFLVPGLREWLTLKRRETWRGQATLCLEERAVQWSPTKDARFLPSLGEYLRIVASLAASKVTRTPRDSLTPGQRSLLRTAFRWHAKRTGLVMLIFLTVVVGAFWLKSSTTRVQLTNRVKSLSEASPGILPQAIDDLRPFEGRDLLDQLKDVLKTGQRQKLNAALALAEYGEVRIDALVDGVELWSPELYPRIVGVLRKDESKSPKFREFILQRFQTMEDAEAKAKLAAVALHLGDARCARQMLARKQDPTARTAFIVGFRLCQEDVPPLAAVLQGAAADADFRSGLLAAMAMIKWDKLREPERETLRKAVVRLYTEAPDAATHSAACCVLTNWIPPAPGLKGTPGVVPDRDWFVNGQGMTMIRIPADAFVMGDSRGNDEEKPAHQVRITRDFFLSDREVTRGLFERFVAEAKNDANHPAHERVLDWTFLNSVSPDPDCPAHNVSWFEAVQFCNWLSRREGLRECYPPLTGQPGDEVGECDLWSGGYRLPTEAEWEYACRAGTTTRFSIGDDQDELDAFAWLLSNSQSRSWPAGKKLPSAWGLFDMHGNLLEWCDDRWEPNCHTRLVKASRTKVSETAVDATFRPTEAPPRVVRGGSWKNDSGICRSAYRDAGEPAYRRDNRGFRVAAVPLTPVPDVARPRP